MIISALLVVVAIFSVGLALTVWFASSHDKTVRTLFGLMSIMMALWAIGLSFFMMATDTDAARLATRIFYVAAASFTPLMLLFALTYPRPKRAYSMDIFVLVLSLAVIVDLLIIFVPDFIISNITDSEHGLIVSINPSTYLVFASFFIAFFVAAIATSVYRLRHLKSRARSQVVWYLVAIILTSIPGFYANLILPYYNNYNYVWAGPLAVIIFLAVIAYSIVRHHMFDVKSAAVRTLAYALSLVTLAGIYFGFAYVASTIFFDGRSTREVSMSPVNILIALVLAFIFQPIKQFFDRITDNIFFRDRYDTDTFISQLGDILTSTTTLRTMLEKSARHIELNMKASSVTFVVFREGRSNVVIASGHSLKLTPHESDEIKRYLQGKRNAVLVDELPVETAAVEDRRALRIAQRSHISILMPLADEIGYLMLGDQKSSGFTKRDIKVLETVSDELVIAIQNARSLQEIQELNTNLQQRIDVATKELRRSNEKLRKLDIAKDEFISMASHQLRTPLTSVKGYLSMVLEGDAGKVTPQQQKLLSEAFTSSERMVHLVSDFLSISRIQTGKFVLDTKPTNLADTIQEEIAGIERLAEAHGIPVIYKHPKSFPVLNVDEDKLRQVVMNFIDNAIYYSRNNAKPIVVKLHATHDDVFVEVHDHGIGVPKDAQGQLFTKFYRAENAQRQRPDGTGVGLFLAKKVIVAHGGEVVFESTENLGSVFGFKLPRKKLEVSK